MLNIMRSSKYFKIFISILIISLFIIFARIYLKSEESYDYLIVSNNDENKIPLKIENDDDNDGKILCIITTTENKIIERSLTVWDTWAKKCDKTLFACNCKNFTNILKSDKSKKIFGNDVDYEKLLELPILQLDLVENYNFMAQKVLYILKSVFKTYSNLYKWFFLVDDDTFVFVDNLKSFLLTKKSTEPYTYGYNFKTVIPTGYHSGGGGVLFTHESLKRIYKNINSGLCNIKEDYGDVAIGECSYLSKVKMGNSLDELGRERFHTLDIVSHYKGDIPDWLYDYSSNGVKIGKECCSEESITFHYTSPDVMKKLASLKNSKKLSDIYDSL